MSQTESREGTSAERGSDRETNSSGNHPRRLQSHRMPALISGLSACFALRSLAVISHVAGAIVEILRICAKELRIAAAN